MGLGHCWDLIRLSRWVGCPLAGNGSLPLMSCIFYGERDAVATFQLTLPAEGGSARPSRVVPAPILVKGCESRFNIERWGELQLCAPSYYREDRESLVWDEQECVVSLGPRGEERRDDPGDLERLRRLDADRAGSDPLRMAVGKVTSNSVEVIERVDTSLVCGDNCLIWCSAAKPESKSQWSDWWDSLEDSYDDYSTIRDPHTFAQALGAMAFQQRGLLGNPISFANPRTGQVAHKPVPARGLRPGCLRRGPPGLHRGVRERGGVRSPQHLHQDRGAPAPARVQVRIPHEPHARRQDPSSQRLP